MKRLFTLLAVAVLACTMGAADVPGPGSAHAGGFNVAAASSARATTPKLTASISGDATGGIYDNDVASFTLTIKAAASDPATYQVTAGMTAISGGTLASRLCSYRGTGKLSFDIDTRQNPDPCPLPVSAGHPAYVTVQADAFRSLADTLTLTFVVDEVSPGTSWSATKTISVPIIAQP